VKKKRARVFRMFFLGMKDLGRSDGQARAKA
jgi:hypothetical protein